MSKSFLPDDDMADAFDFGASLAPVPPNPPVAEHRVPLVQGLEGDAESMALGRRILPWLAAQVAAAIVLGTCVAQAMVPTYLTVPSEPVNVALRLTGGERATLIPVGIADGWHLRLSVD